MSYNELRQSVKEAWEAIAEDRLITLLREMKDRCQAVIDADGMHTAF
jgi:hypothetical protein